MRNTVPLLIPGLALAVAIAATSASAHEVPFARIDLDDDMVISERELVHAFGEDRAERILNAARA